MTRKFVSKFQVHGQVLHKLIKHVSGFAKGSFALEDNIHIVGSRNKLGYSNRLISVAITSVKRHFEFYINIFLQAVLFKRWTKKPRTIHPSSQSQEIKQ